MDLITDPHCTSYVLACALLPAVAVRRRRSPLQLAVVSLVADPGALGAAAQRVREAAGPGWKFKMIEKIYQKGQIENDTCIKCFKSYTSSIKKGRLVIGYCDFPL